MTVMLYGLAEIWMEISLLEIGSAADDATYNFFPYSECHAILMIQVFSAVLDLESLIGGGFSKTCPSDLGKAQDVPLIMF